MKCTLGTYFCTPALRASLLLASLYCDPARYLFVRLYLMNVRCLCFAAFRTRLGHHGGTSLLLIITSDVTVSVIFIIWFLIYLLSRSTWLSPLPTIQSTWVPMSLNLCTSVFDELLACLLGSTSQRDFSWDCIITVSLTFMFFKYNPSVVRCSCYLLGRRAESGPQESKNQSFLRNSQSIGWFLMDWNPLWWATSGLVYNGRHMFQ